MREREVRLRVERREEERKGFYVVWSVLCALNVGLKWWGIRRPQSTIDGIFTLEMMYIKLMEQVGGEERSHEREGEDGKEC